MSPNTAFTILASDKPFAGVCSRCGGAIGRRVDVAVWNGAEFWYCNECQLKAERKS